MYINQIKNLQIHFVLCMERTGSSILTMMLNRNDCVLSPSEEPFVLYLYKKYKHKTKWTNKEIDQFIIYFTRTAEQNLSLFYSSTQLLKSKMIEHKNCLDFETLIKLIYSLFLPSLEKKNITHIIDKQIKYILYANTIEKIIPNAKFVILVRDPRSVVCSWKKRKLGKSKELAYTAKIWALNYQSVLEKINSKTSKYLLLKYEDLVLNNNETLQKLCDFYFIPFNEDMLSHHEINFKQIDIPQSIKNLPPDIIEKIIDFHKNSSLPLNPNLVNEWENELSSNEIRLINKITSKVASQYGYNVPNSNYSISIKQFYYIIRAIWDKKIYLYIYIKSPLWLKSIIKKYRPNNLFLLDK